LLHSAEGRFLSGLHDVLAFVALGANAVAAAWGGVSWLRKYPSTLFWPLLRVAQATVAVEVLVGVLLWLDGRSPPDSLHYVYGVAPLFVAFVTEGMRVGAAQRELADVEGDLDSLPRREQVLLARRIVMREIGVMTVGTLLVVTLLGRAAGALV
jgi:hypothetical protein